MVELFQSRKNLQTRLSAIFYGVLVVLILQACSGGSGISNSSSKAVVHGNDSQTPSTLQETSVQIPSQWVQTIRHVYTNEWTDIPVSSDARLIHIAAAPLGDDVNPGTEASPLRSFAKAKTLVRDGYPDRILFRRGDTFVMVSGDSNFRNSGRSPREPFVMSYYGDLSLPRPKILSDTSGINFIGTNLHDVAIIGLHFQGVPTPNPHWNSDPLLLNDPSNPTVTSAAYGIRWTVTTGQDLLIEDCFIERFNDDIDVEGGGNLDNTMKGIILRRSVIVDAYSTGGDVLSGRAEGIYVAWAEQVLIEQNIFDHNGWIDGVVGSIPNIYSHNIYISQHNNPGTPDNPNFIVSENMLMQAAATGTQFRTGGIFVNNLLYRCAQSLFIFGIGGRVVNNVVLNGKNVHEGHAEGNAAWGIVTNTAAASGQVPALDPNYHLVMDGNIVAHSSAYDRPNSMAIGFRTDQVGKIEWGKNIVYDWAHVVMDHISGTNYQWSEVMSQSAFPTQDGQTFVDPNRSLGTYNRDQGTGVESADAFLAMSRQQSRTNWNSVYTASNVNQYFREGFTPR